MGTVLTTPLTSKGLHRIGNEKVKVAACEMQGHRGTMEDAHCILLDFTSTKDNTTTSFFGVFDGHGSGGEWSSDWFAKNLPNFIKAKNSFKKNDIIEACLESDQAFIEESTKVDMPYKDTGTTAIFCILETMKKPKDPAKPYKLIIGNIGDSRCLLLRDNGSFESVTVDHKPNDENEAKRIVAAGGHVSGNRVNGVLAISRALGDHTFKDNVNVLPEKQRVCAVPDIYTVENFGGDDMIFLICDGIYEGSNNEAVVAGIKKFLKEHPDDPAIAISKLFDKQVLGSQDNMSAILIQFKDGSNYAKSPKGEIEYVPCALVGGAEFSKAFHTFAQRYGQQQQKSKKHKKDASGSKKKDENNNNNNNNLTKADKMAEKEVEDDMGHLEIDETTASSSKKNTDEPVSEKRGKKRKAIERELSVLEISEEITVVSTPRRSSRIQRKNNATGKDV